jgi:predicted Zn-dependent protease
VPLEDDYNAIRQAVWLQTDSKYKAAAEALVRKKAFMESKQIEDKPNDFSREEPVTHFDAKLDLTLDKDSLEALTIRLSEVFRRYPDVQRSGVSVSGGGVNKYLVNSEGTRLRVARSRFSVSANATVQADDGMKLSDSFSVYTGTQDELPGEEELVKRCEEMVTGLLDLRAAPKLESYTGPVLFEKQAAASLFLTRFAGKFAGGQRPVGGQTPPDDFEKKIGKRILPRWMNVVDDPTRERIDGEPVIGHYAYDDQGVAARPVRLVENGRLKGQLMSRNPSKVADKSTGHGRGAYGPRASVGCLVVEVADGLDAEALTEELIEACQDEDLEFGIRIASFGSSGGGMVGRYFSRFGFGGSSSSTPLAMYKVYPDGREELVRGAEIAEFDIKAFKRMLAAGAERHVLNSAHGMTRMSQTVVAPAMLFEELDLAKIDRDFDKPPILESPLAREGEMAAD